MPGIVQLTIPGIIYYSEEGSSVIAAPPEPEPATTKINSCVSNGEGLLNNFVWSLGF